MRPDGARRARPPGQRDTLADLIAEHQAFDALSSALTPTQWVLPSAAAGWTIGDQVAHLADTEEVAADTITGGPRTFSTAVSAFATAEKFTDAGCRRGRAMRQASVIGWWRRASRETLSRLDRVGAEATVAWGFGMPVRVFVIARLMEHWAHGLDIIDALGGRVAETDRLWHIAELGRSTLPYALALARVRPPAGHELRLILSDRTGATRELGDPKATDTVRGPLLAWCRVAVRRARFQESHELLPDGPLAELAVQQARAYL
ncbi:MAG: maleylpyruvate isomerase family mycothiol-dependent enzyme [Pseudonocardiaceae bacterium]